MSYHVPTVLVTGVNSGIGLAILQRLRQCPLRIIATAREPALRSLTDLGIVESERLRIRPLDLCNYEGARKLVEELETHFGGVDILINNAGVAYRSVVEHMTVEEEEHQMRVNYLGPSHLMRLVLPSMRKKRSGRIINISSVSGMMAMPTMASYSASKFALEGASEALWYELRPWGIHVTLVQPGFVHSKSFQRVIVSAAGRQSLANVSDPYHSYYKNMTEFVERIMLRTMATPQHVAERVLAVVQSKNPPLRIHGTFDAWFFFFLRRILPRPLYHLVLFRFLPKIWQWGPKS